MKKIPNVYLSDILEAITKIEKYLSGMDRSAFLQNDAIQDAVIRRFEIIGEAVRRLDQDFREQFPELPWKKMVGMRDMLIHGYDEVDLEYVWKLASEGLAEVKEKVSQILSKIPTVL